MWGIVGGNMDVRYGYRWGGGRHSGLDAESTGRGITIVYLLVLYYILMALA